MRPKLQLALGAAGAALCLLPAGCGGQEAPLAPVANEAGLGEADMGMNDAFAADSAQGDAMAESNEVDPQGPEGPAEEAGNAATSNVTTSVAMPAHDTAVSRPPERIDMPSFHPPATFQVAPMPPIYMPPPPPPRPPPPVRPIHRGR